MRSICLLCNVLCEPEKGSGTMIPFTVTFYVRCTRNACLVIAPSFNVISREDKM